jgi:hypothetical protein
VTSLHQNAYALMHANDAYTIQHKSCPLFHGRRLQAIPCSSLGELPPEV